MDMDKTAIGVLDNDERTQMVTAPVPDATQMAMNVDCPVCHTQNPPSETYCIDCGFLLDSEMPNVGAGFEIPPQHSVGKLMTTDGMREFPLNTGANTVGRENADVLLVHNTVSRKHATVTVENGGAWVEDAGSTNGTMVAGVKIAPGGKAELTDGCEVTFGSFVLKYQASIGPDAEAAEQTQIIAPEQIAEEPEAQTSEPEPVEEAFDLGPAVEEMPVEEPKAEIAGRLVSKDGALSFDLHDGTNTVGRREGDNDIVMPDPYCSGRHADLTFADGKFTLTDVGSTNGTLVNGVKLEIDAPREVQEGDEITLGRTVFRLEVA